MFNKRSKILFWRFFEKIWRKEFGKIREICGEKNGNVGNFFFWKIVFPKTYCFSNLNKIKQQAEFLVVIVSSILEFFSVKHLWSIRTTCTPSQYHWTVAMNFFLPRILWSTRTKRFRRPKKIHTTRALTTNAIRKFPAFQLVSKNMNDHILKQKGISSDNMRRQRWEFRK